MTRDMGILSVFYWLVTGLGLLALVGGFLGSLHPAGDSLAVARGWLAGGGFVWLALGWALGLASPLWLLVLLVAAGPLVWTRFGPEGQGGTRSLYQKNMLYRMADRDGFRADLLAASPDFITLQEVSDPNRQLLEALRPDYPHQLFCPFQPTVGGVAILSKWPMIAGTELCGLGAAAVRVANPDGPLWVASVHLPWPWPFAQPIHVDAFADLLKTLEGPVVIGGDFNGVAWSSAVRKVAAASGTRRAGRSHQTYAWTGRLPVTLPIDHVLVPPDSRAKTELRPFFGSDHRGLLVQF